MSTSMPAFSTLNVLVLIYLKCASTNGDYIEFIYEIAEEAEGEIATHFSDVSHFECGLR